jgi:hypothetical protein
MVVFENGVYTVVLLIFFSAAMFLTCPILSLALDNLIIVPDNLILVPSCPLSGTTSYLSHPVPCPGQPHTCPIISLSWKISYMSYRSLVLANLIPVLLCPLFWTISYLSHLVSCPGQSNTCLFLSHVLVDLIPVYCLILSHVLANLIPVPTCPSY